MTLTVKRPSSDESVGGMEVLATRDEGGSMVNTRKVEGRRQVRYESYDDLLADLESLIASGYETLGNWSLGQILEHLAKAIHTMIDGAPFSVPMPIRWVFRLLLKRRFLSKTLPPGFKLPKSASALVPDDSAGVEEGMAALRAAIERLQSEPSRAPHGGFGKLTNEEWDDFQLRHCEMHMSFVIPGPKEA